MWRWDSNFNICKTCFSYETLLKKKLIVLDQHTWHHLDNLQLQILYYLRPSKSEILAVWPSTLFNQASMWFWCTVKFENHGCKYMTRILLPTDSVSSVIAYKSCHCQAIVTWLPFPVIWVFFCCYSPHFWTWIKIILWNPQQVRKTFRNHIASADLFLLKCVQ